MIDNSLNVNRLLKDVREIASMVVEQEAIETILMTPEELKEYYLQRFGAIDED